MRPRRFFPLSMGSEGSCQIGGKITTNAGGVNVVRYDMAPQATGTWASSRQCCRMARCSRSLKSLRKDNTGYDLKSLLVGSEGTLRGDHRGNPEAVAAPGAKQRHRHRRHRHSGRCRAAYLDRCAQGAGQRAAENSVELLPPHRDRDSRCATSVVSPIRSTTVYPPLHPVPS